jgi:hypothetical protein
MGIGFSFDHPESGMLALGRHGLDQLSPPASVRPSSVVREAGRWPHAASSRHPMGSVLIRRDSLVVANPALKPSRREWSRPEHRSVVPHTVNASSSHVMRITVCQRIE